jgi:translation initiation factor SUI1
MFPESKITVSVRQRNGKKCKTYIYGWGEEYDLPKICSYFKKTYSCNGAVMTDDEYGLVIELSGDKRFNVYNFLLSEEICSKENITIKGV